STSGWLIGFPQLWTGTSPCAGHGDALMPSSAGRTFGLRRPSCRVLRAERRDGRGSGGRGGTVADDAVGRTHHRLQGGGNDALVAPHAEQAVLAAEVELDIGHRLGVRA